MKQTVYFSQFQDAFCDIRPSNFSLEGLGLLWDYLEQYEQDTGTEIELDVIGLCCEWEETDYQGVAEAYGLDDEGYNSMTHEEKKQAVMDYLCDNTSVAGETEDGSFVFMSF